MNIQELKELYYAKQEYDCAKYKYEKLRNNAIKELKNNNRSMYRKGVYSFKIVYNPQSVLSEDFYDFINRTKNFELLYKVCTIGNYNIKKKRGAIYPSEVDGFWINSEQQKSFVRKDKPHFAKPNHYRFKYKG